MVDLEKLESLSNKLVTLDWSGGRGYFKGTKTFLLPDVDVVVFFEMAAWCDEYNDIEKMELDIFDIWLINDLGLRVDVEDDVFELLLNVVKHKLEV